MRAGDPRAELHELGARAAEHLVADLGVGLDRLELLLGQLARLEQDPV
jgi:hypothetical protein